MRKAIMAAGLVAATVAGIAGCHNGHKANVMATVNGKPIMKSQVSLVYESTVDQQQTPGKVYSELSRLKVLQGLINYQILMQRAAKMHLVASNEEVNAKLNEYKAPFTAEEFKERLDESHLTFAELKREIRERLTRERLINKEINSKIDISNEEIADFYNEHKLSFDFQQPEYDLAEIVVTNIPENAQEAGNLQNSKAMNELEARKKIQMLYRWLRDGDDFGTLASNFSEDSQNARNGGNMGYISEDALKSDPEVYDAIKRLIPGEMTGILSLYRTPAHKKVAGYAIYKLLDKEAAGQRALSDPRVQQAIRQQLHQDRAQLLEDAYLEILRNQSHVQNYYAEEIFKNGAK